MWILSQALCSAPGTLPLGWIEGCHAPLPLLSHLGVLWWLTAQMCLFLFNIFT